MLIARAGDGSMRDAQSAFDQVIAFAGETITADDVSTVLGLVRRDLLLDIADAVAREDAAAIFDLAGQAVESGYDAAVRDSRAGAADARSARRQDRPLARWRSGDRGRRRARSPQGARGAVLRRRSDARVRRADEGGSSTSRASAQPRYHLEMALLRWMHLRKLVPLSDLIQGLDKGAPATAPRPAVRRRRARPSRAPRRRRCTAVEAR